MNMGRRKGLLLGACAAAALFLWGLFRGGTAAELLPEKPPEPVPEKKEGHGADGRADKNSKRRRAGGGMDSDWDRRKAGRAFRTGRAENADAVKRFLKRSAVLCCAFCLAFVPAEAAETIDLRLENAPVRELLQNLAEMCHQNIIFAGEMKGGITAHLEQVTPEEALRAVVQADGLVARKEGNTLIIYDGSLDGKAAAAESFRLSYASAEEVAESLGNLFKDKRVAFNSGANSVIVSGTEEELFQARRVISELDRPEKQVKVEAEVLAVNTSDAKELGIDWDFQSLTGSADYNRESWTEQRYVTDDTGNVKFDEDGNPRIRNIVHDGWEVDMPEGYAGISYGRSVSGHPYTFFFQAKLAALVSSGKARVLARPNVVTMNGRPAEILIGSEASRRRPRSTATPGSSCPIRPASAGMMRSPRPSERKFPPRTLCRK